MFGFSSSKIPQVSADEVYQSIDDKSVSIIDVRTEHEFSKGKIKNSTNIPLDQVADKAEKVLSDKNKKIYVYCLSGNRSEAAAQILQKLGYKNIFNMTSGLLAWRIKRYPLV